MGSLVSAWDKIANELKGDLSLTRYSIAISMVMDSLPTNDLILDIGCGQGLLLNCLQTLNCDNLIGLEISPTLVKKTREHVEKVNVVVADVHYLPFRNKCLKIIFATDTIEHWQYPFLGMTEITRVTGNNGRIVVTTDGYQMYFLKKLGLVLISGKEQPIEKEVHPLIFKRLLNRKLKLLAYYSWGYTLPVSFIINLLRKYSIDFISVIKKLLQIRKQSIKSIKNLLSARNLIKRISFYKNRIKKRSSFPLLRYLFFSSHTALLFTRAEPYMEKSTRTTSTERND